MKSPEKMKVLQIVGAMNRAGTETMLMNLYRNIDSEKSNLILSLTIRKKHIMIRK